MKLADSLASRLRHGLRQRNPDREILEALKGARLGDYVKLETRRGIVEVKVRSDSDVPENMVFMPFCYAEAAANLLTNPALDPFGKIPEFKFCAVRVSSVNLSEAAE